ncbi:BamA/TamA family outer membrane protein [Synechococcus moorigangaii CMS01]|nr:BamA/TamA family outer membrane protein [Synechococcus moorigangaii CMS01]
MQKQQNLDSFSPQTLALWAAIATLGAIAPAQAEPTLDMSAPDAAAQTVIAATPVTDTPVSDAPIAQTPEQPTATSTQSQTLSSSNQPQQTIQDSSSQQHQGSADKPQILAQGTQGTPNLQDTPTNTQGTPNTQGAQDSPNEPRVLVAEIQINGVDDNLELEQEIIQVIETQAGRPTTVSQIRNDVNRIYATGLFSNVVATPEDTALGVRVTFDVIPNPILTDIVVQALPLEGSRNITPPEVVDNIFRDRFGETINLNDFQEGSNTLRQLQQWYQDNGYDLANVIGIDEPSPDGVVTLVVVEGVIEDIQVNFINADNEPVDGKTREFIITREMELKPGDVFRRDVAQRDLQRVFGLGLFEDVQLDFTAGTEDPTQAVLNLNVIEGNTGSIAAGGGISSASGFFGSLSYQQQNLGGNNQRLAAEFQLGQRDALFDVSFTDPWIAGDPFRTSYSVNAFRRRSISLIFDGGDNEVRLPTDDDELGDRPRINRIGGGVVFSRPLSKNVFAPAEWRASLGFDYNRIRITDSDGNTAPVDELGNQLSFSDSGIDDLFALSLNVVRDKRETFDGATRGSVTRFGTDQTIPLGSGNIFFNRLRASHSIYLDSPLKFPSFGNEEKPHTLALNIQGGTILGDLPPYEAFSLGGSNSVRGFEEGDVGSGRHYLQATAEYRFPIFAAVGGAIFADYATDLGSGDDVPGNPAGVRGKPGSGFGYGIGVRVNSPLGPIRVDYGIADNGDSRIHFGIGERF